MKTHLSAAHNHSLNSNHLVLFFRRFALELSSFKKLFELTIGFSVFNTLQQKGMVTNLQ